MGSLGGVSYDVVWYGLAEDASHSFPSDVAHDLRMSRGADQTQLRLAQGRVFYPRLLSSRRS